MNNVVLISGVQKSDSLICIHVSIIFKFFPHLGQHRILSRVPCAIHLLQSYLSLCDPVDCSPPGSILHGILQARILEWVAIPFSKGSFQPRDRTGSPTLQGDSLLSEPPGKPMYIHNIQSAKKIKYILS